MKQFHTLLVTLFATLTLSLQAGDQLKHFPAAEEGMTRHIIQLPKLEDESSHQVELIIGKTVQTDERNRYFFGGKIETATVKGFGYTRYLVKELGPMAGTLMAVDPNAPKVDRFITLGGEPYLIRYNSRLPIVVYVPEGTKVRYRVWSAEKETKAAEKG